MADLPQWLQFIILLVVADILPIAIIALIANLKFFPVALNMPLLFVGLATSNKLNDMMPVSDSLRNVANITIFVAVFIFGVLAIKNKWLWDKESIFDSRKKDDLY